MKNDLPLGRYEHLTRIHILKTQLRVLASEEGAGHLPYGRYSGRARIRYPVQVFCQVLERGTYARLTSMTWRKKSSRVTIPHFKWSGLMISLRQGIIRKGCSAPERMTSQGKVWFGDAGSSRCSCSYISASSLSKGTNLTAYCGVGVGVGSSVRHTQY